jgi:hypothetical protein
MVINCFTQLKTEILKALLILKNDCHTTVRQPLYDRFFGSTIIIVSPTPPKAIFDDRRLTQ